MDEEIFVNMPTFVYRVLYARRLQERGGLTFREAWKYGLPFPEDRRNPTADADTEMSYWDGD